MGGEEPAAGGDAGDGAGGVGAQGAEGGAGPGQREARSQEEAAPRTGQEREGESHGDWS